MSPYRGKALCEVIVLKIKDSRDFKWTIKSTETGTVRGSGALVYETRSVKPWEDAVFWVMYFARSHKNGTEPTS